MPHERPLTRVERIIGAVARLLGRLPAALQRRLAGGPPIVVDGQTLDPALQLVRAFVRRRHSYGYCEPTVPAARARLRREVAIFTGPRTAVGAVRDLEIPGGDGATLRARHYAPLPDDGDERGDGRAAPLLVYLHGGGFVVCDVDTHDETCRILCRHARMHVLSVDYRLAPEHPFPAALHDAIAALAWARDHARTAFSADAGRVAIGGDSAGANLATIAALDAARAGRPAAAQLLIYPPVDSRTPRPSHGLFGDGWFLDTRDRVAFMRHYLGGGTVARGDDPRLSPLLAPDLALLPPALLVTAGFDILRDEGFAYADALADAGVEVHRHHEPALGHAFVNMTGVVPAARRAMLAIAGEWRRLLASVPPRP